MVSPIWQKEFFVEKWHAWLPAADEHIDNNLDTINISTDAPDFAFIPALTRRRLSFLTKISLYVTDKCFGSQNTEKIQIIFASQHGELQSSIKLLNSIASEETLSPALFSLSVHNAAAGVFTILSKNTSPHCFVSAGEDTFLSSIMEAVGFLSEDKPIKVLLIIADDQVPAEYKRFYPDYRNSFAIGLFLNNFGVGAKYTIERQNYSNETTQNNAKELISFLSESSEVKKCSFPKTSFVLKKGDKVE
ncbi:MAG: hypothetical protein COA79_09870 [Planctomycetota bacterium]|nr:MAG: hypothetical protein COA79_09870 [Planctomycetota bacterium]